MSINLFVKYQVPRSATKDCNAYTFVWFTYAKRKSFILGNGWEALGRQEAQCRRTPNSTNLLENKSFSSVYMSWILIVQPKPYFLNPWLHWQIIFCRNLENENVYAPELVYICNNIILICAFSYIISTKKSSFPFSQYVFPEIHGWKDDIAVLNNSK